MTDSYSTSETEDSLLDEGSTLTDGISSDEYSSDSYLDDECSRTTTDTVSSSSTSEVYEEDDSDAEEIRFCSYRRDQKWWLPEIKKKHKLKGHGPAPCDIYAFRLQDTILNSINPFQYSGAEEMKLVEIEGYAYKSSSSEKNDEELDEGEEKEIELQPSRDAFKKDPNIELSFFRDRPTYSAPQNKTGGKKTAKNDRNLHKSHFYLQKRKPKLRVDDDRESSSSKSTSSGSSYEKEPAIFCHASEIEDPPEQGRTKMREEIK